MDRRDTGLDLELNVGIEKRVQNEMESGGMVGPRTVIIISMTMAMTTVQRARREGGREGGRERITQHTDLTITMPSP